MLGCVRQRCYMNFLDNALARVPHGSDEMVSAPIRAISAHPDVEHIRDQLEVITRMRGRPFPGIEALLHNAIDHITAFAGFPKAHWIRIWSAKTLKDANKEIERRSDVVGVLPNPDVLLPLSDLITN